MDQNPKTCRQSLERAVGFINSSQGAEKIRLALAMDGGSVEMVNINEEDGILTLHLLGSCCGCPSAGITLLYGIENEIKAAVPEIKEVVAI